MTEWRTLVFLDGLHGWNLIGKKLHLGAADGILEKRDALHLGCLISFELPVAFLCWKPGCPLVEGIDIEAGILSHVKLLGVCDHSLVGSGLYLHVGDGSTLLIFKRFRILGLFLR